MRRIIQGTVSIVTSIHWTIAWHGDTDATEVQPRDDEQSMANDTPAVERHQSACDISSPTQPYRGMTDLDVPGS